MRFRTAVGCFAIALLPQLALAAPPGEAGALQAVFDFCTKVDPAEGKNYDKQADALFKGLTPGQISSLRQSTEYQRGYRLLAGSLPEIKGHDAVLACQAISGIPGHEAGNGPEKPARR